MKKRLLTIKGTPEELAEFQVATKILGHRTMSSHIHFLMRMKVSEAKNSINDVEFQKLVKEQLLETEELSKVKKRVAIKNKSLIISNEEADELSNMIQTKAEKSLPAPKNSFN